jgi:hypothetical protein
MRSWLTWLIAGGLGALVIVGIVDALRDSPSRPKPALRNPHLAPSPTPAARANERSPRCTSQQLALRVENLNGTPALELAHVWGQPCRTPRLQIEVGLLDRAGRPLEKYEDGRTYRPTVGIQPAFAPTTLAPNVAVSAPFASTTCVERRGPRGRSPTRGLTLQEDGFRMAIRHASIT